MDYRLPVTKSSSEERRESRAKNGPTLLNTIKHLMIRGRFQCGETLFGSRFVKYPSPKNSCRHCKNISISFGGFFTNNTRTSALYSVPTRTEADTDQPDRSLPERSSARSNGLSRRQTPAEENPRGATALSVAASSTERLGLPAF